MANNRMYLVHKPTGTAVLLAKYYPTTGWYQFHSREIYDDFFDKVRQDPTTFGDTDFQLKFETDETNKAEVDGSENFPYNKVGHG